MPSPIIPVLLAGGAGTRLWPVSRDALPKQFLPLVGERSTYQETLLRVKDAMFAAPIVITGPDFHFFARRQAEEVGVEATVVIEPMRREFRPGDRGGNRGRAPARSGGRGAGAGRRPHHPRRGGIPRHLPCRPRRRRSRATSSPSASSRASRRPATATSCRARPSAGGVHKVKRFVEKPDAATAARYVREGYLWNSGNFLFRADVLLSELARLEPEMAAAIEAAVEKATTDLGFLRLAPDAFARAPQKSIDYAVMEKTDRAAVVAGDFRWSDIGSWDALFDITRARRARQRGARARPSPWMPPAAWCIPTAG